MCAPDLDLVKAWVIIEIRLVCVGPQKAGVK